MFMKKSLAIIALITSGSTGFAGPSVSAGGFKDVAAVKIEFFSPGNGIDNELRSKILNLISSYQSRGQVQEYTQNGRGMEGETTLCVKLSNFEASVALNQEIVSLVEKGQGKTNLIFQPSCIASPKDPNDPFALADGN